ncbi:hypothetical protein NMY22_g14404 [Coprinellus aureogranulatus]|nr:hypothetical protein NMY22_g14404 [Coprinellus aureogranulatus]
MPPKPKIDTHSDILPELKGVPAFRKPKNGIEENHPPKDAIRLSEQAWEVVKHHVATVGIERKRYEYTAKDQSAALLLFNSLGLYLPGDDDYPRDVQNKFSIVKTVPKDITKRGTSKEPAKYKRFIRYFQCQCGADEKCGRRATEKRQMPWRNVGCLVWVKLVTTHEIVAVGKETTFKFLAIDQITGIFDHSDACDAQVVMDRDPRVPIHPDLRTYVLGLLREKTPLYLVRKKALEWSKNKWPNEEAGNNLFRFRLTHYDSCSLYRALNAEKGICQRSSAEENLDLWLRKDNPQPPNPLLTTSCVHYQPHVHPDTSRFELVIITPEMRASAWNFGHKKQVLMDLTFGFSTGEPIAKFLFSARDSAKAVHADYSTDTCEHFLGIIVKALGTNSDGEKFEISVGNTDNDARERAALSHHFPDALLLLCSFHMMQAWRNNLVKALAGVSKNDRPEIRTRIGKMLRTLLHVISDFKEASQLYMDEVAYWTKQGRRRNDTAKRQAYAALKFLNYFDSYVKDKDYWMAWSLAGAKEAADRLGVPLHHIARTNNALESWNGRLKGGCWQPYLHGGRLPRADYWVLITITEVLPDYFAKLERDRQTRVYRQNLRSIKPAEHTANISIQEPITSERKEMVDKWLANLEDGNPDELEEHEDQGDDDPISDENMSGIDHTATNVSKSEQEEISESVHADHSDKAIEPTSSISHFPSFRQEEEQAPSPPNSASPSFSDGSVVDMPSFRYGGSNDSLVESSIIGEQYEDLNIRILQHTRPPVMRASPPTWHQPAPANDTSIVPDSDVDMASERDHKTRSAEQNTPLSSHSDSPTSNGAASLSSDDVARINQKTTAIMSLQQAHDKLYKAARDLVRASGTPPDDALHAFRGYITPDIWNRLENGSANSSVISLQLGVDDDSDEVLAGLVPFKRVKKERRIQSRGDR